MMIGYRHDWTRMKTQRALKKFEAAKGKWRKLSVMIAEEEAAALQAAWKKGREEKLGVFFEKLREEYY